MTRSVLRAGESRSADVGIQAYTSRDTNRMLPSSYIVDNRMGNKLSRVFGVDCFFLSDMRCDRSSSTQFICENACNLQVAGSGVEGVNTSLIFSPRRNCMTLRITQEITMIKSIQQEPPFVAILQHVFDIVFKRTNSRKEEKSRWCHYIPTK